MTRTFLTAALLLAASPAHADGPAAIAGAAAGAAPAASTRASADEAPAAQKGLALGVELGEPTSATLGFFAGAIGVTGAVGSGTREGLGLSAHVDVQVVAARFAPNIPLRVGLGARYYHHGYKPASIDEIPDSHYGVRAPIAVALEKGSLQLYAEVAPGLDFKRTTSCTLASGPDSICPHAQESPFFVQLVIGARFFFSH